MMEAGSKGVGIGGDYNASATGLWRGGQQKWEGVIRD